MRWLYILRLRLRSLFRRGRVDAELEEELAAHQEWERFHRSAGGIGRPDLAARQEECRDARGLNLLDDFVKDLVFAARILRKAPVFATAAVVTIALGVGASTAIFSVANAVLFRPLPYRNADRLVVANNGFSNADYFDLRNGTSAVFDDLAAVMVFRTVVPREDGSAERINKGAVTPNFLRMMGARIALGRDFSDADGRPQGAVPPPFPWPPGKVAILSHDYFMRRYHGDAGVLGRELPSTSGPGPRIIGVAEPGFRLYLPKIMASMPDPEVWIANDRGYHATNRGGLMLLVAGILKRGEAPELAAKEMNRIAAGWPGGPRNIRLLPWKKTLVAEARPALLALLGAVIFLLLIACSNVANLLLVRAGGRHRELAVRAALGARAGRLTRQLLAEGVLLSGAGTVFGMALAAAGVRELLALAPDMPRLETTSLDGRVLAFAAAAGLLEAVIFGIFPAWRAARPDVMQTLRGGGSAAGFVSTHLLRNAAVVAEVALSFVLLTGSGLMFRSFLELRRIDPGFDPHHLLTFLTIAQVSDLPGGPPARQAFLRDLGDRLRAIPGVESAGAALSLPVHAGGAPGGGVHWRTGGLPADPAHKADLPTVLPGYFETLRSRLIEGRTFTEADNTARRAAAVIDQELARKAFPRGPAVGRQICVSIPQEACLEVIGVVVHQRLGSLAEAGREQIYISDGWGGIGISRHWALRTAGDPARYAAAVRDVIARFAPGRIAVTEMQTMDTTLDQAQAGTRFHLLLIGTFGCIAALLAAVGLYGVMASVVRQRTAEIGVRMALGAAPADIFGFMARKGLALSGAGIALGLAAALALTRALDSLLVGVRAADLKTLAGTAALFIAITGLASAIPARRAARLDPTALLRD